MRALFVILVPLFIFHSAVIGQRSKNKKPKVEEKGPKIFETVGDSLRTDSIVYYKTEIGFIQPDLSPKFKGKWMINVMRRQARAVPDSLSQAYLEFYEDTLFSAYVGCNKLSGKYIIKGPTIKFTILDTSITACPQNDIESWFIKLMQERVSYFGIDENILYLKDVAYNIVFDCSKRKEEETKSTTSQK
ncbi:MAG TPA: META domain-containing protein [Chitinophagaceae bacterium]|jgi:heat shock protein HslJ|nr:META domain-containing protein [Chitinophagaceae bacterium]